MFETNVGVKQFANIGVNNAVSIRKVFKVEGKFERVSNYELYGRIALCKASVSWRCKRFTKSQTLETSASLIYEGPISAEVPSRVVLEVFFCR